MSRHNANASKDVSFLFIIFPPYEIEIYHYSHNSFSFSVRVDARAEMKQRAATAVSTSEFLHGKKENRTNI
jgi:hypothetical protein